VIVKPPYNFFVPAMPHYGGVYSDLDIGCNNQSIRRILASIEEDQGVSVMEVKPYGFSLFYLCNNSLLS
jgi:mannosyltransferase OCH1-like enzyme